MTTTDQYASALRSSDKVAWKLDDVLPATAKLDFGASFLPDALVDAEALTFLDADQKRALNHIRAHGYLCVFGLAEEFILPFVLDRLQAVADADLTEVRALLAFANEEAKHIALFRRFRELFERGFGHHCEVIGPAKDISGHVLSHSELGVGLLILHIEWMTQRHYVESVHDRSDIDPRFRSLLHQHWVEESQHARIDGWIVEAVAAVSSPEEREQAFEDYVSLLAFLDQGFAAQVELDIEALERATGRALSNKQREELRVVQRRSQQRTYLGAGVSHPRVQATIARINPGCEDALADLVATYGGYSSARPFLRH